MQIKYIPPSSARPAGLLQKVAGVIVMIVLAGVALMFSVVLLTAILIIAIVGGVYLWWKTRELRKVMKSMQRAQAAAMQDAPFKGEVSEGEVVEGEVIEVIRVSESRAEVKR